MAALSSLYPLVRMKCPGVIDLMMEDAVAKTYREFCLRSEYLQQTQQALNSVLGTSITLTVPADHYLLNIRKIVRTEGTVKTELVPNIDYTQEVAGTVVIIRDESYTQLDIYYTVCPIVGFDATAANDDIVNRWSDELAAGTAAELRLMPGEPWTSPDLYDFYRRDFIRGWREAKLAREENYDHFQNYTRKRNFY